MATTAPTVRSLDQILSELGTVFNPQTQNIQTRMSEIPGQIQAEQSGLQAKQTQAFGDILSGARRRGTGVAFGGIPLAEQAKYTATEFLPAQARLQQSGREQAMSLQDALSQIEERKQTTALGLQQNEQARRDAYDTEQRSISQNAANADLSRYFNTVTPNNGATTPQANYTQDSNGGFAFYSADNTPITAGQYAQQNNMDIREVLQGMATTDPSAAVLYNKLRQAGNDKDLYNMIGSEFNNFRNILGGFTIPTQYANRAVANKLSTELRF